MADSKISALTADAAPTSDDLVVTVHDVAGTPVNRKVTLADLATAMAAMSGLTAAFAPKTTALFIPAGAMGISSGGSPVIGNSDDTPVWLLDAASSESIGTAVLLPPDWLTFDMVAVFTNIAATSGNVVLIGAYRSGWGDGESVGVVTAGSNQTVAAPSTAHVAKYATLLSGIAVPSASEQLTIRVRRVGGDGADTLGNDIGLVGVRLVKAS